MAEQVTTRGSRWIGRVLRDKWRIDNRISRGGVGTVYAATHRKNGNRVAIKVLHPQFSRDEDTRSRFLQEGYAANQVNHPGVVRILDDDVTEEGFAFLVMELLEGELLEARRVRKGGQLPLREVYEVADQLLDVLATAHDKGIIHRDIKPDNLFVTNEGRLKVLDFGFAQMKRGFRKEQTAAGFLLGTPGFMSPEQAVGNRAKVDAQTDIWAVGATLFNLISGYPVHDGESAAEMLVAAANYAPRSLAAVASGLPLKLVQIVDRAIAFDKADRWPTARGMQAALRKIPGRPQEGMFESGRRSIPDFEEASTIEVLDDDELEDARSWEGPAVVDDDDGPTIAGGSLDAHLRDAFQVNAFGDTVRVDKFDSVPPEPLGGMGHAARIAHAPHAPMAARAVARRDIPSAPPSAPSPAAQRPFNPSTSPPFQPVRPPMPTLYPAGGGAPLMHGSPNVGPSFGVGHASGHAVAHSAHAPAAFGVGPVFGSAGAHVPIAARSSSPMLASSPAFDPRLSRSDEMPAGPALQAHLAPPRRSRVLVFVLVAAFSMFVVIATGLLVFGID